MNNSYDPEGWQYASDFSRKFTGKMTGIDFVRRRKWVRTCIRIDE